MDPYLLRRFVKSDHDLTSDSEEDPDMAKPEPQKNIGGGKPIASATMAKLVGSPNPLTNLLRSGAIGSQSAVGSLVVHIKT